MTMAKAAKNEPTLTVGDKTYKFGDLAENVQKLFLNVKLAEDEIKRLQIQLALAQTARSAYEKAMVDALPGDGK